ncbi:RDD family protein [Natrinema altunense]|uniref:RDD family protein n=1 Tax=Natrinema altunense TaxID=222984 RepID=A0A482Y007_9EURY|nr:RDD family protein [Natrinema altunense]RZH67623.1 RDD family protein [Natrinema altunense]
MTTLRIFGTIHANTRRIVEDDLREFASGADAIAVEQPRLGGTARSALGSVCRYPLFFVGLQLLFVLQMPLYVLCNRDLWSAEFLVARTVAGKRPVHEVDRHPLDVLSDRSPGWIVGNWLAFLVVAVVFPIETLVAALSLAAVAYGSVVAGIFLSDIAGSVVLIYLGAGYLLIRRTLEARNEAMLAEVAALATANDYDRVCLATGYKHLPGMVEHASGHGLLTADVFEPHWRASGEVLESEAVLDRDDSDARPNMETAGTVLRRRAAATGIDWLVIALLAFSASALLAGLDADASGGGDAVIGGLILLWWLLLPPTYFVVGEATYGRTVGKSLLDLDVVRIDGSPCTLGDAIVRTALLPLDFLPAGYCLGAIIASTTDYGQRLGDIAAGTTVVKRERVTDSAASSRRSRSSSGVDPDANRTSI